MRPCQCGNKNRKAWKFRFNDETRKVRATCLKCNKTVDFNAKPRKPYDSNKIEAVAEYKIQDGKRFLKIGGVFKEVYIKTDKKGHMRVTPKNN